LRPPRRSSPFPYTTLFRSAQAGVEQLASGSTGETENAPGPTLMTTTVEDFSANAALGEEVFGAFSLVVRYRNTDELVDAVKSMRSEEHTSELQSRFDLVCR